jgi:hypothetical protein
VEIRGWAIDPDTADPAYVWVTIDGAGRHVYANRAREDVGRAFPSYGSAHGYAESIAAAPGPHRVCVSAANVGAGTHTALGCRDVVVTTNAGGSPFGNLDRVAGVEGGVAVKGWAIDPDTTGAVYVWVTVDGQGRHVVANRDRPDVARVHPAYGPAHGFEQTVPAGPGTHRVCATAANVGVGTHTAFACRDVTTPAAQGAGEVAGATTGGTSTGGATSGGGTSTGAGTSTGRPGAANTGVPAGRTLTVHRGDLTVTTPGAVVDGLDVYGTIVVKADNVVIKNTRVRGRAATYTTPLIHMKDGRRNLVVQDSELVPDTRSPYLYGIIGWNFTLTRVEIQRVVDGVHVIGPNVTVRSSWIHNLTHYAKDPNQGGGPSHDDGVQIQAGSNIHIVGNTIEGGWNAAIQVTQDRGDTGNLEITGNYLDHGLCSVNIAEKASGPLHGVTVSGNTFGRAQRASECAIVRPASTSITATGNRFTDGEAVEVRNA